MEAFFTYKINLSITLLLWAIFASVCSGQSDSAISPEKPDSIPKASFFFQKATRTFFLNQFLPQGDSCGNLEIRFEKPVKIKTFFKCNEQHIWSVDTVLYDDSTMQYSHVKSSVLKDGEGNLQEIKFFIDYSTDSLPDLNLQRTTDIPVIKKDDPEVQSSCIINRSVFLCNSKITKNHEVRVFTYPPGYMRREPVLNYPELKMFHYGKAVKIPTNESIRLKGFIMNYWHILNPPEVEYDTPMKEIREKAEKQKKKRKHFFTIKPID